MIWLLLMGLVFAAPTIQDYLSLIGASEGVDGHLCLISNKTVPYYPGLDYDRITFIHPAGEWCAQVNSTYLLKLPPSPSLTLYGYGDPLPTFCVLYQNETYCSSNSSSLATLSITDYGGETLVVFTNQSFYLFWEDPEGVNYLGQCHLPVLNVSLNPIPYGEQPNLPLYILLNATNASITYIYQSQPSFNFFGFCDGIVLLDAPVELDGPLPLLVISDYNRNFYPFENGISVLGENSPYTLQESPYLKPEFSLPSELSLDNETYNAPEIASTFTAIAALHLLSPPLNEIKPLLLASAQDSCTPDCGIFNVSKALSYSSSSLYLHPQTLTTLYLSLTQEKVLVYATSPEIEVPNATSYKNVHILFETGNTTLSIINPSEEYISAVVVYDGDLLALTTNRTFYKGYRESIMLQLTNNHPTHTYSIEGVSVELWNETGKVADLLAKAPNINIPPNYTTFYPLSFYIPENVPDGYVRLSFYIHYVYEGLPLWQKGIEPVPLPGYDVSPLNLTGFSVYEISFPHYGVLDLVEGYVDLDALSAQHCLLLDTEGNQVTLPLINTTTRYLLACNSTLLKPVHLYFTYSYILKNVSTPPRPPIEITTSQSQLPTNNYLSLSLNITNNQLVPMKFEGIYLVFPNFSLGISAPIEVAPGPSTVKLPLFLPDLPYDNFTFRLVSIEEEEWAGKGAVYYSDFHPALPVRKVTYGLTQHIILWKDNRTYNLEIAVRRPSTLCAAYSSPKYGYVVLSLNGQNYTHEGTLYRCGTYAYYVDSSYSPYITSPIFEGPNRISYYIAPDNYRLEDPLLSNIYFSEGIKVRRTYHYEWNESGTLLHYPLPITPASSLTYNVTTSATLAEGFLNKLYINITNNMTLPFTLSSVEVKIGEHTVGAKYYNLPIFPNETFNDVLYLYGVVYNTTNLTIYYTFSYEYEPLAYKLPIPVYLGMCGESECLKHNLTYIEESKQYFFQPSGWSLGAPAEGENDWLYRIPIWIPPYLQSLSVLTSDMKEVVYSAPEVAPITLLEDPLSYHYHNLPPTYFREGEGLLFFVSSGSNPQVKLRYYLQVNQTLDISNPGVLDFLPSTLYYYTFQNYTYLQLENNNPLPLDVYYVHQATSANYKEPQYTGKLRVGAYSNATSYYALPDIPPHRYVSFSYSSPYQQVVFTHLGYELAHIASNISNLTLSLAQGGAYAFQGGISKDFQGTLVLTNETIPISTANLTWINISRLVFIPRLETPDYWIGDFILYTHSPSGYINASQGQFFITSLNCSAVVGDLCDLDEISFQDFALEAYYLKEDISYPDGWRRGLGNISYISNPEYDVSYWPIERIIPGEYLYALRLYIPTNLYSLYLPAASTIYINGVEVNTSQLLPYLVYGGDNNIVYTSDASNPYATPIFIYGLPTVYSTFEIRNLSISPASYHYVGVPRAFNITFNLTNYGSTYEYVNISSDLPVTPTSAELPELSSILIQVEVPLLPEGNYSYALNVTAGNLSLDVPIILNLTQEKIDFEVNISPTFFNLTAPENATGTITITSYSSRDIVVSIGVDHSGIEVPSEVHLLPNETVDVVFEIYSSYFGPPDNVTFYFTASNITKTSTIEVFVYAPLPPNISFNISAHPTFFNLTRPENATGTLYITSNSSDRVLFSIYSDHPAVIVPSYAWVDPNTTVALSFNVSSIYLNDNTTAHIYVTARNLTQNVSLNLTLNLPEPIIFANSSYPDNKLRLVLDKTLLCVNETTTAYVYDSYGRYVDGAEVITSLSTYIAKEGRALISFDRPGTFYVRATKEDYKPSSILTVVVEECNLETINEGNLSITSLQPQVPLLPEVRFTYHEAILPTRVVAFSFEVPDEVLVNTSAFIRVYDAQGLPFSGLVRVISPSGKEYFYHTDQKGYALVFYPEEGTYRYEVIYQGKSYPGPETLAFYRLAQPSVSTISLPWYLPLLPLLLLLLLVAKVEVIAFKHGTLVGRVTNIFGMPIKNAEVKVNEKVVRTDNNGLFKVEVGRGKAKIRVKWRITVGDRERVVD